MNKRIKVALIGLSIFLMVAGITQVVEYSAAALNARDASIRMAGWTAGYKQALADRSISTTQENSAWSVSDELQKGNFTTMSDGSFWYCNSHAVATKFYVVSAKHGHYKLTFEEFDEGKCPNQLRKDLPPKMKEIGRCCDEASQIHIYPFHRGYADLGFPLKLPPMELGP
jgi:hypothetical protein